MEYKEFVMQLFYATQDYIQREDKVGRDKEAEEKHLKLLEQVEKQLSKELGNEEALALLTNLTDIRTDYELPFDVANFCAGVKLGYFMSRLLHGEDLK